MPKKPTQEFFVSEEALVALQHIRDDLSASQARVAELKAQLAKCKEQLVRPTRIHIEKQTECPRNLT